jgi:hypothetical protein
MVRNLLAVGVCLVALCAAPEGVADALTSLPGVHLRSGVPLCEITAAAVAVRQQPYPNAAAVGVAHHGDQCSRLDAMANKSGCWNKVRLQGSGVSGWVRHERMQAARDNLPVCVD